MSIPPLEYIAEVRDILANVAQTYVGAEHLTDTMSPPRYTWIPSGESWSSDWPSDDRIMGALDTAFVVHVYGSTYEHAWRMRHALLTALRMAAHGTFLIGPADWPPRDKGMKGCVVLQTVHVTIPIPVQALPTTPGGAIEDEEPLTGQAAHVSGMTQSFIP